MNTQLITIAPDGSISGLDFKRKGLDLRQFGHAATRRISEVEWDEERQKWRVVFLMGGWAGDVATAEHCVRVGLPLPGSATLADGAVKPKNMLMFTDYEDAVAFEITIVQAARLSGNAALVGNA